MKDYEWIIQDLAKVAYDLTPRDAMRAIQAISDAQVFVLGEKLAVEEEKEE